MTGLPQHMTARKGLVVDPRSPEQRAADNRLVDAKAYQMAARYNSYSFRQDPGWMAATERLACEQYAYARYLMGIDDYWLTVRRRVLPRVDW